MLGETRQILSIRSARQMVHECDDDIGDRPQCHKLLTPLDRCHQEQWHVQKACQRRFLSIDAESDWFLACGSPSVVSALATRAHD